MTRSASEMFRRRLSVVLALAALAVGTPAGAVGVSPGAATPVQREQAQAMFKRGKGLFDAKKYPDALAAFQASMEVVASPNARLYVARCLRETGKLVEAYVEFDRTAIEANEHAREDSRYARTGASARVERDAIAPKIGFVVVRVDHATDATRLKVAGEDIRQAGWAEPIPVAPGETEIVVETPPSPPQRTTVTVAAGEKKTAPVDAAPASGAVASSAAAPRDRRALRPYAYVAGGVGALGMLTLAIAGILSDTTYSDLSSSCKGPCPPSKQSEVSTGQAEQTAADVGLAIGIVGLGIGTTLFLLSLPPKGSDTSGDTPKPPGAEPGLPTPSASVSLGPGWLGLRGTF
jgi:hypothetical protein